MLLEGLGPGTAAPTHFNVPVPALGAPPPGNGATGAGVGAGVGPRGSGGGGTAVQGGSPTGRRGPLLPPAVEEEGLEAAASG